ncbi:MAG: hypothetical protein M1832_000633 [Thelocarpon impressellum]|nr:MAG: hypothetical protein M1832_000633 [Thelocarpon impressellum]
MTYLDTLQTLSAAFILGVLCHYAFVTKLDLARGCGTSLLRDRRRLVLVLFLLFASLWAKLTFLDFAMPSKRACQATTVFSTLADQTARSAAAAVMLGVAGDPTRSARGRYLVGGLVAARFVVGCIFVAFIRPQFAPICVATASSVALGGVVIGVDAVIMAFVVVRAVRQGAWEGAWKRPSTTRKEQSKAMICFVSGYALWFATSIPLLLGLPAFPLFVRAAVPCIGLYVLIALIAYHQGALVRPIEDSRPSSPALESSFPGSPPVMVHHGQVRHGHTDSDVSVVGQISTDSRGPLDAAPFSKPALVSPFRRLAGHPRNLTVTTNDLDQSRGPPTPAKDFPPKATSVLGGGAVRSPTSAPAVTTKPLAAHPVPSTIKPRTATSPATPPNRLHTRNGSQSGPSNVSRVGSSPLASKQPVNRGPVSGPSARETGGSSRAPPTVSTTITAHPTRAPSGRLSDGINSILNAYALSADPQPSRPDPTKASASASPVVTYRNEKAIIAPESMPGKLSKQAKDGRGDSTGSASGEVMKVWFVEDIVYDNPAQVQSIMDDRPAASCIARKPLPAPKGDWKGPRGDWKSEKADWTGDVKWAEPIKSLKMFEKAKAAEPAQTREQAEAESVMNRSRQVARAGGGRAIFPRQELPTLQQRKRSESTSPVSGSYASSRESADSTSNERSAAGNDEILLPARYASPQEKRSRTSAASVPFTPSGLPPPTPPEHSPIQAPPQPASAQESGLADSRDARMSLPPTPSSSTTTGFREDSTTTGPAARTSGSSPTCQSAKEACVPFMLDPTEEHETVPGTTTLVSLPVVQEALSKAGVSRWPWHIRVGDSPPSFSTRKGHTRSKTLPLPTPLALRSSVGKTAVAPQRPILPIPAKNPARAATHLNESVQNASQGKARLLVNKPTRVSEKVDETESLILMPSRYEGPHCKEAAATKKSVEVRSDSGQAESSSLWAPPVTRSPSTKAHLWTPSNATIPKPAVKTHIPPIRCRPMERGATHPLSITSSSLWNHRRDTSQDANLCGVAAPLEASGGVAQAAKSRPKRKSRPMTTLLDIIESPRPIPGKADALGVFQAPWGPTDSTRPLFRLSPPMIRALQSPNNPSARAVKVAISRRDSDEYSNNDDDFDESTLWEIASLLCAQDVYSNSSMTPDPRRTSGGSGNEEDDEEEEMSAGRAEHDTEHVYNAEK